MAVTRYTPPSIAFNPKSYPKPKRGSPRRPAPAPIRPGQGLISSAEQEADRIFSEFLPERGLPRASARREAERSAQQEIARAQALSQALMALGIPARIQGIYGQAAGSIGGLAQGFSSEFAHLAAAQGAEQANMVAGTGQEGAVRNEGVGMGDVLYGSQGFIPARGLEQTGAAFASQAALEPGFALQFGQIAAARQMQDFIENVLPEFTEKEALIRTKRPSLVAEARERRRAEATQLYEAGLMTQREYARKMGVRGWRKFPNRLPGQGPSKLNAPNSKMLGYLVDDYGNPIRDSKGKRIFLPQELPEPEVRTTGGYIWERDPRTGRWVPVGGTGPAPKAAKGYQLRSTPQGLVIFDPNTGQTQLIPSTKPKGKPKYSADQRKRFTIQARNFARIAAGGGFDEEGGELPPLTFGEAVARLATSTDIPMSIGLPILRRVYLAKRGVKTSNNPQLTLPWARPKGEPARGGRRNTAFVQKAGFSGDPEVIGIIQQAARQNGLDADAVLAVALAEGGLSYGAVGDNGDSHGPFQLNRRGALGRRSPAWANSPAGLRWAIRKMAEVGARGLRGRAAIEAIVRRFERPRDPDSEIERALSYYYRLLGQTEV